MNTDRVALEKALEHAEESWVRSSSNALVIEAAREHLATLPKPPRMVETWHVEYVLKPDHAAVNVYRSEIEAKAVAGTFAKTMSCARVTGPHSHEMPAT